MTIGHRDHFFELSLDMLCIAGFDGYFKDLNPAWKKTLGFTNAELTAKPFIEFVHPDDRDATTAEAQRLMSGIDTVSFENRYLCRDGSYRWLLWSATVSQQERLFFAVARDITERRRGEETLRQAKNDAENATQAKSEFLSRMSHELRTPLNAILGFGQLLGMDTLAPEHTESVNHILKAGQHLLGLIDEVLDIARIEAGRLAISLEPVQIGETVKEVLELVGPIAGHENVRLNGAAPLACEQHVVADRQRIKQVLLNLLSNAVKYNRKGGTVTLECVPVPSSDRLQIRVQDTGQGIPADKMGRLFMPFERLGLEGSAIEGTGLGLALSKRLVELMGGTLSATSTVGQGSTFVVNLKLTDSPVKEATVTAPIEPEAAAAQEARTVLYIEDNLSNLTLIQRLFARRPEVKLVPAMQGRLGLDLAREHHPDLVLLDLHLPDMNGDEVLRRLQADPETNSIPVIVISANAMPSEIKSLLGLGAREYLTKPLDVKKFFAAVDAALGAPKPDGA